MSYRIGFGIDFHRLQQGPKLFIGGVEIPHSKGAVGHSDADVLLHAICDAMLGALALGDIGVHFPNTDEKYKDIDSKLLLIEVYQLVKQKGYRVVNIDSSVCLEAPKIMPYAPMMRQSIFAGNYGRRCFHKSNHYGKNGFCRQGRRPVCICQCVDTKIAIDGSN